MSKNYYNLTKKQLDYFSYIEEPIVSSEGIRLSRPIVLVFSADKVIFTWTLSWFKFKVRRGLCRDFRFEIRALY